DEITAVLKRVLEAWSSGSLSSLVPDRTACECFSAEHQAAALVRALEGAPAEEPFVPGRTSVPPSLQSDLDVRFSGDPGNRRCIEGGRLSPAGDPLLQKPNRRRDAASHLQASHRAEK